MSLAWVYEGIWGVLASWFRVPREAPSLPSVGGEDVRTFRPAEGYLNYLKLGFWISTLVFDIGVLIVWIIVFVVVPLVGVLLLLPVMLLVLLPNMLTYVAIHLRYDSTWYVMSSRSIRLRRGIWSIAETTITFENVQNISIRQGPLQRYFGIADVEIRTAGGGSTGPHGHSSASHQGLIQGIADAPAIRDLIEARVRASRSAGLGDDQESPITPTQRREALARVAREASLLRAALNA